MVKEFDSVVFSLRDTGSMDLNTGMPTYEPIYADDQVHGPVQTKFGWHLIKMSKRNFINPAKYVVD